MFNFFKKKSPIEKLLAKHQALLAEAHTLSTINRTLSDQKTAEASEIMKQIEELST